MTERNDDARQEPAAPANPFRDGLPPRRTIDPCAIVLFGATGDLTRRKLVPAIFRLYRDGHLQPRTAIVGVARREISDEDFRASLAEPLREHLRGAADEALLAAFLGAVSYHATEFESAEGYASLKTKLSQIDARAGTRGNRLFYLATAPEYFAPIAERLGAAGAIAAAGGSPWTRVVVEKPFGQDLASAIALNRALLAVLDESQIYRIDHYLGKETVQNILAFRFANGIFEPLWNQKYIDHVQITVAESLGVEGRGPYYDQAGAVRDMVQNHMMQLLSLVAMEPPSSMEANAVRDEKVKVLKAIRPLSPDEIRSSTVRAQYGPGSILGEELAGYRGEPRVPEDSTTPTYAAMRLHVDTWRWSGTPFLLRHGKRLPKRVTEIAIQFRRPPMRLFGSQAVAAEANLLVLNIQPDEGISLCFGSKLPGPDIRIGQVKMDFRYGRSFGAEIPEAYERLLLDAVAGDSTLFTRRDEVESSWRFFDPILRTWVEDGDSGLETYPAGSWGPEAAERLFAGVSGGWRRL